MSQQDRRSPLPRHRRSVPAVDVAAGDRFMRRDGRPSAAVAAVKVVKDSFGTDAYVRATLTDKTEVTIAIASSIRVYTERVAGPGLDELIALPVQADSPEASLAAAARAHPDDGELVQTALRLVPGINLRAGAHLSDLADAADRLVLRHADGSAASGLIAALTSLDYDGNEGRWRPVRHGLALAAWLAERDGHPVEAQALAARLRAGEEEALAELNGPAAAIRRREVTEPHLHEKEIQRARETGNLDAERSLRHARWRMLLALLAHGEGPFDDDELRRRIDAEVAALGDTNET